MRIIGLTGSIATGKSTVSKIIRKYSIPVIDTDLIGSELLKLENVCLELKNAFGTTIFNKDNSLDICKLADIVFSNHINLEKFNNIINDKIIKEIKVLINKYRETNKYDAVVIDSALLIEMNLNYLVDEIWVIDLRLETHLKRLMERDSIDKKTALRRIQFQMSTEDKKKYADVIIDNNKDIYALEKSIKSKILNIHRKR